MKAPMGKDENTVIASTAALLRQEMRDSAQPDLVLLRFVRGVMQSHSAWGAYALGCGTALALLKRGERTCRVCGCTESDACLVRDADGSLIGCHWLGAADLCNACLDLDRQLKEEEGKQ